MNDDTKQPTDADHLATLRKMRQGDQASQFAGMQALAALFPRRACMLLLAPDPDGAPDSGGNIAAAGMPAESCFAWLVATVEALGRQLGVGWALTQKPRAKGGIIVPGPMS